MHRLVLIADFDVLPWQSTTSPVYQTLFIIAGFLGVVLLVLLWFVLWRTPRQRHHSHRRRRASGHSPTTPLPRRREKNSSVLRLFRFNRHRRHHRRANPTIAEVGGSPRQRDEHPPAT